MLRFGEDLGDDILVGGMELMMMDGYVFIFA